jgi:glycerol-3-phosphate dehydrogenase
MRSARALGAELAMPACFMQATLESERVVVQYQMNGKTLSCMARVLVNAAGPWVNRVIDRITPATPHRDIDLVRGAHIRLAGTLASGIYYLESSRDGRAVFAMPRGDSLLVGTTEVIDTGADPAVVSATPSEQEYLLDVLSAYFPRYRLRENRTLLGSFAGLRVLPGGTQKAFNRSRETVLLADRADRPRLLSIYGGKLTTWRATAQKVMERIHASLPPRTRRAHTDRLVLVPD